MWVPKSKGDRRPPNEIPESERDYYLERKYPAFGNMVPHDVTRNAKQHAMKVRGVRDSGQGGLSRFRGCH